MKLKNIFSKILTEQAENKKLINFLLQKWNQEDETVNEEKVIEILGRFGQIKNKLEPNLPQVVSFLSRFDGKFGFTYFDPKNLKDVTKYRYNEILSLINEYEPLSKILDDIEIDVPIDLDHMSQTEKLRLSKDLWFGTKFCIINEGNFRVYDIPNELTSKIFGFYLQSVANRQWCVTVSSWKYYRFSNKRSFYFVIDESRPQTDKYFLSALQYDPTTDTKFRITSMEETGDYNIKLQCIEYVPDIYGDDPVDYIDGIKHKVHSLKIQ